ncbi:MAG: peptide chain release factor N(5)-glutamine methyltransferase [Oscillospiraceae bacterium]|jgi:release factor glutamine methyltransferase|nr:peptide chain release factor N(5)-glutamine methyltransferase [Oscillospiraceae bacterium]
MPRTYNEIYIDARRKLREAGTEAASLEARLIISAAAGKRMDTLLRDLGLYTSDAVAQQVSAMVEKRLAGEPVAYITGSWEFYGLPLTVTRDVLIPRNDTELLAETVITALRGRKMDARVIDLCTGSGCVGCAIAHELPATRVVLADVSRAALNVARQNVMHNRLNPRVTCIELDALADPPMALGSFDLLSCNPPYIPSADIKGLDPSVKDYEPVSALDGGEDGLDFYRAILKKWHNVVRVGGLMIFEVGIGQAGAVTALMRASGLNSVGVVKDTQGIDRVCFGNI